MLNRMRGTNDALKIVVVAGARPNFVKIAPILRAMDRLNRAAAPAHRLLDWALVHTGQHYDDNMSAEFFTDLGIPPAKWHLQVGSGSHATQTAQVMRRFEPVLCAEQPDLVLVVGDVNSTAACALTAAKLGCRVAHVEAGLRSFDRSMPEEINRVVTDALADVLFTTEEAANQNLRREGHAPEKIFFVGNVMIDSLRWCWDAICRSTILGQFGLREHENGPGYALATVHRAQTVDSGEALEGLVRALAALAQELPVLLPAHPRTRARLADLGLSHHFQDLQVDGTRAATPTGRIGLLAPLRYLDFLRLLSKACVVLTDSGGIQEETTVLGVPCLTLRSNTERPVTLTAGMNVLVGTDPDRVLASARQTLRAPKPRVRLPALWDGQSAERIARILAAQEPRSMSKRLA
jgi:UDP-N-acetylglucosamine 2-epimerase (non-hydrolysing)